MGISGVSIGSLLIVLVIVMLLFGTKRLRTIGSDLGGAVKGFRSALKDVNEIQQVEKAELISGKCDVFPDKGAKLN